nr:response regulator transcription factor [Chryseobacterium sp. H1D6B]
MITDLKMIQNDLKILIFSGHEKDIAIQYIREGAEGYLSKQSSEEEIKTAVKTILEKGSYYPADLVSFFIEKFQENNTAEKLSSREYEIFQLLADGQGNLEIANALNLQMSTISTYKKRVFEKLNIKNIAELIKVYKNQH